MIATKEGNKETAKLLRGRSQGKTMSASQMLTIKFYGWPDNDPPGTDISDPVLHKTADGTGTYEDPITVAVKGGRWAPGSRMYVPHLKKYLIIEDKCAHCEDNQIDIWMNSDERFPDEVSTCKDAWTADQPALVEIDPPPDRDVSTVPFFDTSTGTCFSP